MIDRFTNEQIFAELLKRGYFALKLSVKLLDSQRVPPIDKEANRRRTKLELEFFELWVSSNVTPKVDTSKQLVELALTNFHPLSSGIWLPVDRRGKAQMYDFAVSKAGKLYLIPRRGWEYHVDHEHFDGSAVWAEWRKKVKSWKRRSKR